MDPNEAACITPIPKRRTQKQNQKEPLEHGVTRLQTGVEAKAGLRLISRAPSAGVQPDPTGLCIRNQLDRLYLQGEPLCELWQRRIRQRAPE